MDIERAKYAVINDILASQIPTQQLLRSSTHHAYENDEGYLKAPLKKFALMIWLIIYVFLSAHTLNAACENSTISDISPNVNFQYNAGNGTAGPPGSFGMTNAGTRASAGSISWHVEFQAFHSKFNISITPLTPTIKSMVSACPGGCRIADWCDAIVQPHMATNPYPFGKTSGGVQPFGQDPNLSYGWLGFQAFGDGNDCAEVLFTTNKRTFRVAKNQSGWAMWRSPFIVSDDRKVILGYKWDDSLNSSYDYRIFDLAIDEWGVSFLPMVAPNGSSYTGNCGSVYSGIWGAIGERSFVRMKTPNTIIELATQVPQLEFQSPFRFRSSNANRSFDLVISNHPRASSSKVQTPLGLRAIRQYLP